MVELVEVVILEEDIKTMVMRLKQELQTLVVEVVQVEMLQVELVDNLAVQELFLLGT